MNLDQLTSSLFQAEVDVANQRSDLNDDNDQNEDQLGDESTARLVEHIQLVVAHLHVEVYAWGIVGPLDERSKLRQVKAKVERDENKHESGEH